MKEKIKNIYRFFTYDMWHLNLKEESSKKKILIKQLRVLFVAIKGFNEDSCLQKASALTYYTLLSVVPIFAMFFGIAKGFGFERKLEAQLYEEFADKKDILDQIFSFANSFLENTQGGIIAGAGMIVLFWSVMKVLGNIESSFNEIWQINKGRSFGRKLSDYLTIMLLTPIFFIISNSATIFISNYIDLLAETTPWLQSFGWLITLLFNILPYSLIWFVFSFLYIIIPNTKVKIKSAIVAGIVGGIIFQIVQYLYIKFQVGVAQYNAIYGSFAALPLFLVWLQTSWLIVLLGAELSYAIQNVSEYESQFGRKMLSHTSKIKLSVLVTHIVVKNFEMGEKALISEQISEQLDVSDRFIQNILNELTHANVLCETKTDDDKLFAYQPAISTNQITATYVITQLENSGLDTIIPNKTEYDKICSIIDSFNLSNESSEINILLKDI